VGGGSQTQGSNACDEVQSAGLQAYTMYSQRDLRGVDDVLSEGARLVCFMGDEPCGGLVNTAIRAPEMYVFFMLCHVALPRFMARHVMLCYVMLCYVSVSVMCNSTGDVGQKGHQF
jgi:hypothetical protein